MLAKKIKSKKNNTFKNILCLQLSLQEYLVARYVWFPKIGSRIGR